MENLFIWAQILGFIAMGIALFGLQFKKTKSIMLSLGISELVWTVQFLMLGGIVGAVLTFCSASRNILTIFTPKTVIKFIIPAYLLIAWAIGIHTFQGANDLLPLIGTTIFSIALYRKDNRALFSRSIILCCSCWLIYACTVLSYMGVVYNFLSIVSVVVGMARHEQWKIGKCYKTFLPSLARSLFVFPNFRTYP